MPSREEIARAALAAAEEAAAGRGAPGEVARGTAREMPRTARPGRGGARRRASPPPPDDSAAVDPEPDPHDVARQIVLRQLTMAPRSRAELEQKLAQRGCDPEVAQVVLDRMEEVGLVDDEAYAGMLVRSHRAGRGLARTALRSELRKKGVDAGVIEEAVAELTDEDERAEARRLVDKKLRTMHGLPAPTQARRLAAMLARKGYGSEIAYAVVREALRAAPEHQRD